MRLMLAASALFLLTACPETPSPDAGTPTTGGAPAAGGTVDQNSAPPGGAPSVGQRPEDARFDLVDGETVALKGAIVYDGELTGSMRVDFLTISGNDHPRLVHADTLPGPGDFTLKVPRDYGEVHMVAFIDVDGDGPSSTDPAATSKLEVGSEDIDGLTLTLTLEPDLGALTPGGAPENAPTDAPSDGPPDQPEGSPEGPEGAGGPPPDGAPPPSEGPPPEGEAAPSGE